MLRIAQKVGTRDLSLTGAEHIAAGSMEYETDIFESDDDESDDDQG